MAELLFHYKAQFIVGGLLYESDKCLGNFIFELLVLHIIRDKHILSILMCAV